MERWKGTFKFCNLASPRKIEYVHNVYILNTAKYGYFKFSMSQNSTACTVQLNFFYKDFSVYCFF